MDVLLAVLLIAVVMTVITWVAIAAYWFLVFRPISKMGPRP
jgi:hypothetical protein